MGIRIRCKHCGVYNTIPDHFEAVKNYCASGGMIQTFTERIITQIVHKHYVTPGPLWKAEALTLPFVFLAPSAPYIIGMNPLIAGILAVTLRSIALVWASTEVEEQEIPDEPPADDEPESEQGEQEPARFEQVTHPGKNSVAIRWPHEPPRDKDPKAQQRLYHADLALAKAATDRDCPLSPISFAEVQKRRISIGEKTFYRVQRQWDKEALVIRATGGAVYLNGHGKNVLSQYASQ